MPLPTFADISGSDIGAIVTALGVLAVLAVNIKNLFWPTKPTGQEYVQKQELTDTKHDLAKDLDAIKEELASDVSEIKSLISTTIGELRTNVSATLASYVTRAEIQKIESKLEILAQNHKDLAEYTHKNVHEMLDKINSVALRIEAMHRAIDKEMAADRDKILDKIDQVTREKLAVIERLAVKVEINSTKVNAIELHMASLREQRRQRSQGVDNESD